MNHSATALVSPHVEKLDEGILIFVLSPKISNVAREQRQIFFDERVFLLKLITIFRHTPPSSTNI